MRRIDFDRCIFLRGDYTLDNLNLIQSSIPGHLSALISLTCYSQFLIAIPGKNKCWGKIPPNHAATLTGTKQRIHFFSKAGCCWSGIRMYILKHAEYTSFHHQRVERRNNVVLQTFRPNRHWQTTYNNTRIAHPELRDILMTFLGEAVDEG